MEEEAVAVEVGAEAVVVQEAEEGASGAAGEAEASTGAGAEDSGEVAVAEGSEEAAEDRLTCYLSLIFYFFPEHKISINKDCHNKGT